MEDKYQNINDSLSSKQDIFVTANPELPMNFLHRNTKILMIVLAVLVVVLGITLFVFVDNKSSIVRPISDNPSITLRAGLSPTTIVSSITDETANWQTYRNEEYSYAINYPSNYEVNQAYYNNVNTPSEGHFNVIKEENEVNRIGILETDSKKKYQGLFEIIVFNNPKNLTLEEWSNNYKRPLYADPKVNLVKVVGDTSIANNKGKVLTINTLNVPPLSAIVTIKDDFVYLISFDDWDVVDPEIIAEYNGEEQIKINTQILSTFRFIENGAGVTANPTHSYFPVMPTGYSIGLESIAIGLSSGKDLVADLVITTPDGLKVGFDPRTNTSYSELLECGSYGVEQLTADDGSGAKSDPVGVFDTTCVKNGTYKIEVIGKSQGQYKLHFLTYDKLGDAHEFDTSSTIQKNGIDTYKMEYSNDPKKELVIREIN